MQQQKETCKETGKYDPKTGKKKKSKQQKLPQIGPSYQIQQGYASMFRELKEILLKDIKERYYDTISSKRLSIKKNYF